MTFAGSRLREHVHVAHGGEARLHQDVERGLDHEHVQALLLRQAHQFPRHG